MINTFPRNYIVLSQKYWPSFTGLNKKPSVKRGLPACRRRPEISTKFDFKRVVASACLCIFASLSSPSVADETTPASDSLPAWQEGSVKQTLLDFLLRTTDPASPDFVKPDERIAVFDHDGTLLPELPMRTQLRYAVDRVRSLARQRPEWYQRQPYKAVIELEDAKLGRLGDRELMQLLISSHSGFTPDDFDRAVKDWLAAAKHPRFQQPYTKLVYQPMRELMNLMRERGYKIFIMSGDSAEFIRTFSDSVYGVPLEQVIGSQVKTEYRLQNGRPALFRLSQLDFIDERTGKPAAAQWYLGRKPRIVVGNAGGDLNLMQWASSGEGARLALILRHDDGAREYDYAKSGDGRLSTSLLNEARQRGWLVVSMKNDWRQVFAFADKQPVKTP